jgi:hypothetical protein
MKFFVKHFFAGLTILALTSVIALGKDKVKKDSVTFPADIMVNGTLVKAGDYQLKFDENTNELSILKNGKVVAQAKGQLRDRAQKARDTTLNTVDNKLVSVAFSGQRQDIVIGQENTQTGQ